MKKNLLRCLLVVAAMVAPVALASPAAADSGQALRVHGSGGAFQGDFGWIDYHQGTYWETIHARGTVQGNLGKGSYYLVLLYRCEGWQSHEAHTRSCTESWRARIDTKRGQITLQSETRPESADGPFAFEVTGGAGQFEGAAGSGTADATRELLQATGRLTSSR